LKLSAYPFPSGLEQSTRFVETRTSDLLDNGLAVHLVHPGIPLYTPIGTIVLRKIEQSLQECFASKGIEAIRIPALNRTEDLSSGDQIGEQFASKIIHLKEPLDDFHLLTTPEMSLIHTIGAATLSHSQLPMRLCYTADFFRNSVALRSFLTCRQFRIFGALGFEPTEASVQEAIDLFLSALLSVLGEFSVSVEVLRQEDGAFEIFYPTAEGDYRADKLDPTAPLTEKRLLSLGMAYRYGKDRRIPIRMRTSQNKNARPFFSTFGLCTNRLLFAVFDASRTEAGFFLPRSLRPFDVVVVPRTQQEETVASEIVMRLAAADLAAVLDDRYKIPRLKRQTFSDLLGIPATIRVEHENIFFRSREGLQETQLSSLEDCIECVMREAEA
jgi:prolyl-tRNA synthetase